MALVGGGGAPHTAGSNPAGTGSSINYIGQHAYAYSGAYQASTTAVIVLDFSTSNQYVVGKLFLNGTIESGSGSGEITTAMINFNGQNVARLKVDSAEEDQPVTTFNEILIPPFTDVTVEIDSSTTNSGRFATVVLTGRVYDA